MIELVINHTSDQHPWFKAARLAPPGSPERDMYVWSAHRPALQRRAHHLHRHGKIQLDLGRNRQSLLLAPLLFPPARPQLRQSRGDGRSSQGHALLARHGRRRPAHGRHSLPGRARRHLLRKPARDPRRHQDAFAPPSTPSTPTASSWPKPTSGPPTSAPTSAMATNATWPSTSP